MQIYAEAESRANEFIQIAMPRREQYFCRRQIYAEAESRANEFIQIAFKLLCRQDKKEDGWNSAASPLIIIFL